MIVELCFLFSADRQIMHNTCSKFREINFNSLNVTEETIYLHNGKIQEWILLPTYFCESASLFNLVLILISIFLR